MAAVARTGVESLVSNALCISVLGGRFASRLGRYQHCYFAATASRRLALAVPVTQ